MIPGCAICPASSEFPPAGEMIETPIENTHDRVDDGDWAAFAVKTSAVDVRVATAPDCRLGTREWPVCRFSLASADAAISRTWMQRRQRRRQAAAAEAGAAVPVLATGDLIRPPARRPYPPSWRLARPWASMRRSWCLARSDAPSRRSAPLPVGSRWPRSRARS
jgi:hypothetical protein